MEPFYGFGMGATSLLRNYRFTRPNNISKYYRYIKEIEEHGILQYYINELKPEVKFEKLELFMMGKLRTSRGLDLSHIPKQVAQLILKFYEQNLEIY